MANLEELTLAELKEIAKEKEIKNISKLKKEELIEILSENNNKQSASDELNERYKITSEGDSIVEGILEVLPDGYGFLRGENYLPTPKDVYTAIFPLGCFITIFLMSCFAFSLSIIFSPSVSGIAVKVFSE